MIMVLSISESMQLNSKDEKFTTCKFVCLQLVVANNKMAVS